jgi:sialic acid synthase SpsE
MEIGRPVGTQHPPFIIAALDARELRTLERALVAIDQAAHCRVDAIKLAAPVEWIAQLLDRAESRGLALFVPALDEAMVQRLDWIGVRGFYLVFDWSDLELVAAAARTGKPIVMQVGTGTHEELEEIVATVRANGHGGIALVQSVIDLELEGLDGLHRHEAVVGIADRSADPATALEAISRGASIVEVHLAPHAEPTSPANHGPLASVVRRCEQVWAALGPDRVWTVN